MDSDVRDVSAVGLSVVNGTVLVEFGLYTQVAALRVRRHRPHVGTRWSHRSLDRRQGSHDDKKPLRRRIVRFSGLVLRSQKEMKNTWNVAG